jgi:2-methylcitrate dehydratase PrpD
MPTYAERFAEFAVGLTFEALPRAVVEDVKLRVQDVIGICLACARMPYAAMILRVVREMEGRPDSTVLGHGTRCPAALAAFVNGSLAHGADFDDTHPEAIVHASSVIVPAALAVGERERAGGRAVIAAAVAGYEVALRVGAAASAGFHDRGYHATPVCGVFGAAVTAGKLLELDAERVTNALGICGSQAAGTLEWLAGGAWSKRMQPGWAAQAGITAALLAREGFTGPRTIFEGTHGFYRMHVDAGRARLERLAEGLGTVWETLKLNFKPYPCGHYNVPFMDCARILRERHAIDPEAIEAIECRVPRMAVPLLLEPREEKLAPANDYAARFSMPYSLAVILVDGAAGIDAYSETRIRDPRVLALARRVTYSVDGAAPAEAFPAHLTIRLRGGRAVEHSLTHARGSRENPMSAVEHRAKFAENARRALDAEQVARIADRIAALDILDDVRHLTALCASGERGRGTGTPIVPAGGGSA